MKNSLTFMFAVLLFAGPKAANAAFLTFDFEEFSGNHNGALVTNGFVFDPGGVDWYPEWSETSQDWTGHYHIADPSESVWTANNGTKYFAFDYFLDASNLNIYGESGQEFGVRQLDLAEAVSSSSCGTGHMQSLSDTSCGLSFVGYLADGGMITRHVTLDGVADGVGSLNDFQTFTFDGAWNRLDMFSLVGFYWLNPGLDNLVVRTVPEPSGLVLLGLGILGMAVVRRSRPKEADRSPNRLAEGLARDRQQADRLSGRARGITESCPATNLPRCCYPDRKWP